MPAQARPVAVSTANSTVAPPPAGGEDYASAAALAYRWQKPIEVVSAQSSTTREWAMPDGSFSADVYLGDEWAPGPIAGKPWNRIDLTLSRRADGTIGPAVDTRGLSLSAVQPDEAEHLVATLGAGTQQVGIGWPGALPEPVLRENLATYADVRPGVDLLVEALASGFEFSIVVKTREAAQALGSVRLPWRTGEYTPRKLETGAIELVAADGQVHGELPTADMFDASQAPETGEARQIGTMEMTPAGSGTSQSLVLTPDTAALADPATVYPVKLDPPVTLRPAFDAFVATNYRSDQSGSKDLKLGHVVDRGQSITARSYLRFDGLKKYAGADVVSAELFLWNYHSWSYSCDSAGWDAYISPHVDSRLRWTNQPDPGAKIGHSTLTKGDEPRCRGGWVSIPVKNGFQAGFDNGWSSLSIMLRASSESSQLGWKRMYSSQAPKNRPYVSLRYNRKPGTPNTLKISDCYQACASPAMVRDHTPTLSAKVSDPDGGTVKAVYEVWNSTATTRRATSGTALTGVASGAARPWSVTPALPDGAYKWRAKACDAYGCGGWSGWFSFTIDTTNPGLPLVFSTPYADRSTGTWNGGPGIGGQFSFGPNGTRDIAEYKYSLNNGAVVSAPTGPQTERLTADQQQVSADLDGFATPAGATLARDTTLDHGGSDKASLKISPAAASTGVPGDSFAGLTRTSGCMCQSMTTGHRYMASGWIYVPAATGLNPAHASRGLRIVGFYKDAGGVYHEVASKMPTAVGQWQQLHVVLTVPAGATEAFFRLYNGMDYGSGKAVYWDHLSVVEAKVVPIKPTKDGMNVLRVQALDKAGNLSDPRTYMFLVKASGEAWLWGLDEGTGTTAASVPNTRPATFSGTGLSWTEPRLGDAAIASTGEGYLTTGSAVLNTQHPSGFSVAAWVRLTDTTVPRRTIVAQEGANGSMFRLEYRRDLDFDADGILDPAWCFTVTASDAPGAAESRACSREFVVPGDWIPLVGIYKMDKTLELYVKGTPDLGGARAAGPAIDGWSATGPLSMGKSRSGSAAVALWYGDLDEVGAYQRELVTTEILTFACGPDLSWCLEPSS
ncbi:LamG domain-containing protein [Nonomuraea turkmeniaca]|uniref:LamG domain-containing protein n=1 Tax=Nonomuraea turkmeniaca TaxID=103838 RepID=A0A5S4FWI6_9ACTN|nr:DNRLRE domain-containing protein [Nonomuraea turkmeniaca]TMR25009.1 LamG domain-containing protein [Nonomuraea turkmeniaca]